MTQSTFTTQDFQMISDLKQFAKATNFELKNEDDLKTLLKNWVNHRVSLTTGNMDKMFNDYLTAKGI